MKRSIVRFTAKVMMIVMAYQLIIPATNSFALTSGPSQPEVQSFEPVGTTDMVDLFSGDFVYNIPLMDVEGYPINIAYHSGINIEQEASWVGLGWNINPGEINRGLRGVPDDFNGDSINKVLNIKKEKDYRLRLGANIGFEFLGGINLGVSSGQYISYNNYKGVGVGMDLGAQLSVPYVSTGIGMSVGSLDGASIDANAGLTFQTSKTEGGNSGSISFSGSTGFNTRSGLKNFAYSYSLAFANNEPVAKRKGEDPRYSVSATTSMGGIGFGSSIPVGLQNYVPVVTNASTLTAFSVQVKLGLEALYAFPHFNTTLSGSTLEYDKNGTRASYGYLYAQHAGNDGVMDFSREKDGIYNSSLPNLPLSSMTYDVYSISGQGTGGMFRPFRNDLGSVFDPEVSSKTSTKSINMEFGAGIGFGGLFEFGSDISVSRSKISSGPWFRRKFRNNSVGSLFENAAFKQAGEMTYSLQQDAASLASHAPVYFTEDNQLKGKGGGNAGSLPQVYGNSTSNRSSRANHLSYITNDEAAIKDVTFGTQIQNYPRSVFVVNNNNSPLVISYKNRSGSAKNNAKGHHIGEMTQVIPDGRRYVYGIPAMNNFQKEATFAVNGNANISNGLVQFTGADDTKNNNKKRDNYYQATYTPAYAHSYLLTAVLSPDYTDVTGDGMTEDDLGSYTKLNYSLADPDYRWVAPVQAGSTSTADSAQYNPGFWSDPNDDKGNYVIGSRESWYLHSVETKNYVAEFYTSKRDDARGVKQQVANSAEVTGVSSILTNNKADSSLSYKLDSIKLYNKHDRITNGNSATPIKTVIFAYDYSLCPGVPNNVNGGGKLTLKKIYFRYGKSDKSLLNPYVFDYSNYNRPYNFADKDRWGNCKPNDGELTNYEFPYVNQAKIDADTNATNWHLTQIQLPSGGTLKINYEADDYSYVQDQRTMEMFRIAGVGSSNNFAPRNQLYQDIDRPYEYIYFRRDKSREIPGKSMKENYLENTDLLYFSFNVDIAARNRYEHIKGYAKVEDIGYCDNNSNSDYGYIKVKLESAGQKSDKKLNPVTLAGLNTGRYYLPHVIYPGYNEGEPGDMEVLKGLVAATKEMLTIWQNANVRFVKNGLAKEFKVNKSWIRLHTPGYTKLGGGTRVKTLKLEDTWDEMASNGAEAVYGRSYDYTTLKDNKQKISSGVASYEPMIGADENPLRKPVKYTADAGRLLPAIEFYQEEPFGESFYPSPSVGYSKVTVSSINKGKGRSAMAEDVFEFYTAKDFPIEVDFTEKSIPVNMKHSTLTNKSEEVNVLQGYALRMNDMHGKTKSVSNYVLKDTASAAPRELITSTKYNYQTENGKLYNKVKAVKRSSLVQPTYSVTDMVLGEEVDFTVDNRKREMTLQSTSVSFNLNVVNFAFVTIPIPTIFFPDKDEESIFKTMVSTKIIQQYGIVKSVEVIDHGARTVTENVLYDSETGQVLLTKVNNEFNDPMFSLNYPAYWAYDNMGGSYFNTGYDEAVDSVYIDQYGKGYLMDIANKRYFNLGDELLLKVTVNGQLKNHRVWITGMAVPPPPPGSSIPIASIPCDPGAVPVIEPRAVYPSATSALPWIPLIAGYKNVYVKVLRSGRRNHLNASVQNIAFAGPYNVSTFNNLFTTNKILSASMTTFTGSAVNNEFKTADSFRFNPYIKGIAGNYREEASYAWMSPRKYDGPNHTRNDGTFQTFANQWTLGMLPADATACSFSDYIFYLQPNQNWKMLKKVTQYSAYGLPVEEIDAAGIYSTALYGYNNSLPVAVGSNMKNKTLRYFNFEDLLRMQHVNRLSLGIWEMLKPISSPAVFKHHNGRVYGMQGVNDFNSGAVVSSQASHTGNYSLLFTGNNKIKLGDVPSFSGTPYCYVSIWVKPPSGIPATNQILITGVNTGGSQSFTAFSTKTGSIDGWYKLEGKIDMSLLSAYDEIHLSMPANYYLDDVRLYPDAGNMKSFAYDIKTMRLMAELDENNFATLYEYDQEGVLIRVKKETERGILTVNEHRKANAKPQ